MPVKRWIPREQRPFRPHQRVECVVQLASADQHGADLGELAEVAGQPVGLGVDGEELGLGHWLVEQIHERPMQPRGPDGLAGERHVPPDVRSAPRRGEGIRPRA